VGKKMIAFVMVVGLVVMGLVAIVIPKAVQADRIYPTDWEWSGAAFVGEDSFYDGVDVVAYQEGDTAHLTAEVRNYLPGGGTPGDATIQSAVVKFDWGEEYAASNVPAEIGENEYATLDFEFTVPNVDVATNALLHSYEIIVTYQTQGVGFVENQVNWDLLWYGNGWQNSYSLEDRVVSASIYRVDTNATPATIYELVSTTDYTLDLYNGDLSLTDIPIGGENIYASYVYMSELSGETDGYNRNFLTDESPIVPDSERIFIANTVTQVAPAETTDYTIDYETGKVTLGTAPQSYEQVWGTWEYYQDSTDWGYGLGDSNFAVYTDGQADARQLRDLYNDMERPRGLVSIVLDVGAISAGGSQAELEAEALATLGETEYDKGSFEAAADYYQQAIDKMNEAIAADTLMGTGTEEVLDGIGTGAGDWLDGQAAKGEAEADKLEAEAGFADMYGIFIIMAGAGIILVSAGFIVWGVSRLVAARRM
jgi:tetratricopeptide (TPR) repeat protein